LGRNAELERNLKSKGWFQLAQKPKQRFGLAQMLTLETHNQTNIH